MEKFIITSLISDLTLFLTDDYNLSYILINYIKNHLKCIVRNWVLVTGGIQRVKESLM